MGTYPLYFKFYLNVSIWLKIRLFFLKDYFIMKFVQALSKIEIVTLTECIMNHTNYRSRSRAQAILLSNRKYTISQ